MQAHGVAPVNLPLSESNNIRSRGYSSGSGCGYGGSSSSGGGGSCMPATPSPFASMFAGDLTRFLSGTAFAEVRLASLSGGAAAGAGSGSGAAAGDAAAGSQHGVGAQPMLCHASRLTRVSEVLRMRLALVLKTMPARPRGYGGPDAQPLVLLDTPLPVLRVFHRMMYEGAVSVSPVVLPGLLKLAVQFDMPELELWVLQLVDTTGDRLPMPTGVFVCAIGWLLDSCCCWSQCLLLACCLARVPGKLSVVVAQEGDM